MCIDAPLLTGADAVAVTADMLMYKREDFNLKDDKIVTASIDAPSIKCGSISLSHGIMLPSGMMLWGVKTVTKTYSLGEYSAIVEVPEWGKYKPIGYEE